MTGRFPESSAVMKRGITAAVLRLRVLSGTVDVEITKSYVLESIKRFEQAPVLLIVFFRQRIGGQRQALRTLAFRQDLAVAVHCGGRGIDHPRNLVLAGGQENVQGSVSVDKLCGSRIFHGAGNTSQRGLVEYPINTCARPIHCCRIPNVPFNEFEVPMDFPAPAAQFLEVSLLPVLKLSRTRTASPRSSRPATIWLPIKPPPPVTNISLLLLLALMRVLYSILHG